MAKYKCNVCKYIYDEQEEKIKFSELPKDWQCPVCGANKIEFKLVAQEQVQWECEILEIINETHNVKTFHVTKPHDYNFIPGQHALISVSNPDGTSSKQCPFSFSCSPTRNYLMFTIKKVGEVTTKIHDLEIGSKIVISEPYGEAYQFTQETNKNLVCIAGGTGITPFKSILDYISDKNLDHELTILFANTTSSDIIYHEYFTTLNEINKKINIINIISTKEEDWDGYTGYIKKDIIQESVSELDKNIWLVCGPPPMTTAMESLLKELNISEDKIFIEKQNN